MFVAVSYALGTARKAIILLGATKVLFDGVLPFFILKGAGKAGYWLGWFRVYLSCLVGEGSIRCLVLPRWRWSYGA